MRYGGGVTALPAPLLSAHDAGLGPWVVVAGYAAACGLAALAARRARGGARGFWWIVALGLLLLGINKQLDFQTDLTAFFRERAFAGGWYDQRRAVQADFIAGLGLATVAILVALAWLTRRAGIGVRIALIGVAVLGAFVMLRAISFHHVDAVLATRFAGTKLHLLVELGGIAVVGLGALIALRRR
jgi:hypothetical protein